MSSSGGQLPVTDTGCVNLANTAWVLLSFVLVLAMFPGLALFEAGMLPAKDTLSILAQILVGVTALSVLWDVVGYSLVFGEDKGGVIGGLNHIFLEGVPYDECNSFAPTVPAAAFALFQMLFAAITPLLMTGSFAGRMRFWPWLVFTVLWEIFVYFPVAHWMWGDGWLKKAGALDFAGGIVVHTTAGCGAVVAAVMLGPRKDFAIHEHGKFPPSNLPLAATGTGLLWCGWFGFNAGSALGSGALAASAVMSTQIGCCVSALTWFAAESWVTGGRAPGVVAVANGGIGGLAGITPASGFISNRGSLALGLVLGVVTYTGVIVLKDKLHVDDALDVSIVHGLSGVVGALAIGFLATRDANPALVREGVVYGGSGELLGVQVGAVVVVALWSTLVSVALLWLLERAFRRWGSGGLRTEHHNEVVGLDITEHRETAYHELDVAAELENRAALMPLHYGEMQVRARRSVPLLEPLIEVSGPGGRALYEDEGEPVPVLETAMR